MFLFLNFFLYPLQKMQKQNSIRFLPLFLEFGEKHVLFHTYLVLYARIRTHVHTWYVHNVTRQMRISIKLTMWLIRIGAIDRGLKKKRKCREEAAAEM